MKAMLPWLGSALVAVLAASAAPAQCPGGPGIPHAPDATGPGYYAPNEYGLWYGPNYELYPGYGPFNGVPFRFGSPVERGNAPATAGGPYGAAAPGYPYGPSAARPNGPLPPPPGAPGVPYGPQAAAGGAPRMVPYPYGGGGGDYGQEVPGPMSFPTHMWARSPRDFFMEDAPDYYGVSSRSPRPYAPAPPYPAPLTPRAEYPR